MLLCKQTPSVRTLKRLFSHEHLTAVLLWSGVQMEDLLVLKVCPRSVPTWGTHCVHLICVSMLKTCTYCLGTWLTALELFQHKLKHLSLLLEVHTYWQVTATHGSPLSLLPSWMRQELMGIGEGGGLRQGLRGVGWKKMGAAHLDLGSLLGRPSGDWLSDSSPLQQLG